MTEQNCGFLTILGAPNAGKSTLINTLTGAKVSIVTPKAQTTRFRVRGVCMTGDTQIVVVDTPGIFKGKQQFDRNMVDAAWAGAADADALVVLVDAAAGLTDEVKGLLEAIAKKAGNRPMALVLNKVDICRKETLFILATECGALLRGSEIFMISAEKDDGVEDLKQWAAKQMPKGPWLYPDDQLTDLPMRLLAAEITREKLFLQLRQELPYSVNVETESWEEKGNLIVIKQAVLVEREGQKKIIIGEKGSMLKKIGTSARHALERATEKKVHLELFVKVQPDWKAKADLMNPGL